MTAEVNGVETSRGRWSDAQFSFGEMLARASADARLRPGDLIGSGHGRDGLPARGPRRDARPLPRARRRGRPPGRAPRRAADSDRGAPGLRRCRPSRRLRLVASFADGDPDRADDRRRLAGRSGGSTPRASRPATPRSSARRRTGTTSTAPIGPTAGSSPATSRTGRSSGWIALSGYSARRVYSGVAWESVYVAAEARGRGVGRALLEALIPASEAAGLWTLLAGVLAENAASLALHERVGFRRVGVQRADRPGRARPLARRRPARAPQRGRSAPDASPDLNVRPTSPPS